MKIYNGRKQFPDLKIQQAWESACRARPHKKQRAWQRNSASGMRARYKSRPVFVYVCVWE